jgi:hypothetical protein
MFNPFATVSNYSEMLNKVAFFTFAGGVLVTLVLRRNVPEVEVLLAPFSVAASVVGFSIPLGTLAPGFGLALLARMFKLHDRISDVLGIRARFDVAEILLPLALHSRAAANVEKIRSARKDLMSRTFYSFASSSPKADSIPAHYVTMALDQWSWYWVVLETAFTLVFAAAVAATLKHYGVSSALLATTGVLLWALQGIRTLCARSALEEVKQILADPKRRQAVTGAFNEISS